MVRRAAAAPCRTGSPRRAGARRRASGTERRRYRSDEKGVNRHDMPLLRQRGCARAGRHDPSAAQPPSQRAVLDPGRLVAAAAAVDLLLHSHADDPALRPAGQKARRRAQQHGRLPAVRPGLEGQMTARCPVLVCSLFFPGKEKRTRKESREPAWVGPLRPPVSGACLCLQKIFCGAFL